MAGKEKETMGTKFLPSDVGAVLFDLDGVLIDSREVWYHLMAAAAEKFESETFHRQAFLDSFGQGVEADQEMFYPKARVDQIHAFFDAHFMDFFEHFQVMDKAPEVLEGLKARGTRVAIVTNTSRPLAEEILTKVGLTPHILATSSDVPRAKPAPDMLELALEELGVGKSRAWMVGDSIYDQQAAQAAGVAFLGVGDFSGPSVSGVRELYPELVPVDIDDQERDVV